MYLCEAGGRTVLSFVGHFCWADSVNFWLQVGEFRAQTQASRENGEGI